MPSNCAVLYVALGKKKSLLSNNYQWLLVLHSAMFSIVCLQENIYVIHGPIGGMNGAFSSLGISPVKHLNRSCHAFH